MLSRRTHTTTDLPRRILAAGCAALVLALTVFAASPVAHDWLHGHPQTCKHAHSAPDPRADDGCAVVLFAGGVSLPLDPIAIVEPAVASGGVSPVTAADVFLVSPRYLRQPERGPPLS